MKLIVLDRDGVINEDSDEYIKSPEEWVPIPGSLEAIARLNQAGYRVVVATNQSGLARGLFDIEILNAIHAKMHRRLAAVGGTVDAVFFCPHAPADRCDCRKPRPGLLQQISERLKVSLEGVVCVGDTLRDVQAARSAGCEPMLVRSGKGERTLAEGSGDLQGVAVFENLSAVVDHLLSDAANEEVPS